MNIFLMTVVAALAVLFCMVGVVMAVSPHSLIKWLNDRAKGEFYLEHAYRTGWPKRQMQFTGVGSVLLLLTVLRVLVDKMIMKDTTKLNSTATSNQDHVVFSLVVGTLITLVGVSLLIAPMRVLKVLAPPKYLTRQFYEIDRLALMLSLLGLSFIVLGFFILKASLL